MKLSKWLKIGIPFLLLATMFAGVGCTFLGCKNQFDALNIKSFDDCVDAGYPVISGEPLKCFITDSAVFTLPPVHIKVSQPKDGSSIVSNFTFKGEARAASNKVSYRLLNDNKKVLAEGEIDAKSPDLGRWGPFEAAIAFSNPETKTGILEVYDKTDDSDIEKVEKKVTFREVAGDETVSSFDPLRLVSENIPESKKLTVGFTSQAPFADWNAPYQEACEEASFLMVASFLEGTKMTQNSANSDILEMIAWEKNNQYTEDITVEELVRIAKLYAGYDAKAYYDGEVTVENIKKLITAGYPVIIPAAGRMLRNPYYSGDGPPFHMMVIVGYEKDKFITNDPGTKRGEGFVYTTDVVMNAIHDWTGNKDTIARGKKAILVVQK